MYNNSLKLDETLPLSYLDSSIKQMKYLYLLLSVFFLSSLYAKENCNTNFDIEDKIFYLFMGSANIKFTISASKKIAQIRAIATLTEAIVNNIEVKNSIQKICVGDKDCMTKEENDIKTSSSSYIARSDFTIYCEEITNAKQINVVIKVTKEKFKELIFPYID